jgi:general stress protein YciG
MAHESRSQGTGTLRGFAGMAQDKQREIARKGGANVPHDKRSFAQDRTLASEAGRKGGRAVAPQQRSFAQNRELAAAAGRKGGQTSQSRRLSSHHTHQDDAKPTPDDDTGGQERKPN